MPSTQKWRDIASGKDPDYFSRFDGQKWLAINFAGVTFVDRPHAWSLPPEVGPWSDDVNEIALRLLSLLPGLSSAILGDYLFGLWAYQRSDAYRDRGQSILEKLRAEGRVFSKQGENMVEWYATNPDCKKIDASGNLPKGVRMLHTRFGIGHSDATIYQRQNAKMEEELRYLKILESVPLENRDGAWTREYDFYTKIKSKWEERGGIPKGN